MKLLDKLLKKLKTDRNTFFAYILTLLTAYIVIDRVVEILFIWFTGMSASYWGPIKYTLAMACPAFAYVLAIPSKFSKSDETKISFFFVYCIALYIIIISMIVQWVNYFEWFGLLSLPNYKEILLNFSHLIKPAFSSLAIYIVIFTFFKVFFWLYRVINDPIFPNSFKDSILDFPGLDIAPAPSNSGAFSYEITLCKDRTTGKDVKILENRRFSNTVIVGPSGTGKSMLVMEPMIARDLEKKFLFRETAKEMGFAALKSGIASLDCPYDQEYVNKNFNLNMISPILGKEKIFKAYMNKMIQTTMPDGKIVYKNLGLTSINPDFEQTKRVLEIANNLDLPVHLIDPCDANSIGLNPFIIKAPALCGLTISMVIRNLFSPKNTTADQAYVDDVVTQAVQNLCILLKVVFPRLNDGLLPNLEDLLKCFNNFEVVESMCKELEKDPELSQEYELQIGYFKQHFYKDAPGKKDMQRYIQFAAAQLDVLLRSAQVRNIICNRFNNVDLLKVIENGEIVLISTRPTDIGGTAHGGFSKFFLWLMMIAVESRPGNENSRTPYFIYIDDYQMYNDPCLEDYFTQFRKYKVGTIISFPNLASVGGSSSPFMQTVLSNSPTKLTFGNCTPEEYAWWEKEFGQRREWKISQGYDPAKGDAYNSALGNPEWAWKDTFTSAKIQGLKFKGVIYKTKDKKGKNVVNYGTVDFVESKFKEPRKVKKYGFNKYNNSEENVEDSSKHQKIKFDPDNLNWGDTDGEVNPVQLNTTDSTYLFDNEDAIVVDLKNKNKK